MKIVAVILLTGFAAFSNWIQASECLSKVRFPVILQGHTNLGLGQAETITQHAGLDSLFVGGSISSADLVPS